MRETTTAADIVAAIDTAADLAARTDRIVLADELRGIAAGFAADVARDEADHQLAAAFRTRLQVIGMDSPLSRLSDVNIAGFIRCAVRDTGGRIVTGGEKPVGELIGYRRVFRDGDGDWSMTNSRRYIIAKLGHEMADCAPGQRVAALYLLPEAVSDGE